MSVTSSWFTVRDSQGRESRTLFFVGMTWLMLTARFALGMLPDAWVPTILLADYAASVSLVLGIWLGREWIKSDN